jgi:imidazolonepropionase-like amidohydrolase
MIRRRRMSERSALLNVRVFNGRRLTDPGRVVIDGEVIGSDVSGARRLDADGAVLLPGLIDAHVHLRNRHTLEALAAWGVTTALDMATWPNDLVTSLRNHVGLTDIRSAGLPAIGPAGPHAHFPGMPSEAVVLDPQGGERFVENRISEGADYIKIVLEAAGDGGPDRRTAATVVQAAHRSNKQVVAHAASIGAYRLALDTGADVITHIPLTPFDKADVARMAGERRVAVPTLTMMRAMAAVRGQPASFDEALRNVAALHRAGVPILAGTDAAQQQGMPVHVAHGESLHDELALLVQAGLSESEVVRAATVLPAKHFGLSDRGAIAPGLRADLVLIGGDALADIHATRRIQRVWCAGVEYAPNASG